MSTAPNPGSKEAREQGCICPVIDNEWGEGFGLNKDGTPCFVIVLSCPLHKEMAKRIRKENPGR